eukprot:360990-Chlamydomonas_euryale.AAC.1
MAVYFKPRNSAPPAGRQLAPPATTRDQIKIICHYCQKPCHIAHECNKKVADNNKAAQSMHMSSHAMCVSSATPCPATHTFVSHTS